MENHGRKNLSFVQRLDRTAEKNPVLWLPCVLMLTVIMLSGWLGDMFRSAFLRKKPAAKSDVRLSKKPFALRLAAVSLAAAFTFMLVPEFGDIISTTVLAAEKDKKKVDIAFVIDSTGSMGDDIANVKNNVTKFAEYLEDSGLTLRMAVIEYRDYKEDGPASTIVHKYDHSPWHTKTEQLVKTLDKISAGGGGDADESVFDPFGYAVDGKSLYWSSDAYKFAILLTDAGYNTYNRHGYTKISEIIDELNKKDISTSVITRVSLFPTYNDLAEKTGGELVNIDAKDFFKELIRIADNAINRTLSISEFDVAVKAYPRTGSSGETVPVDGAKVRIFNREGEVLREFESKDGIAHVSLEGMSERQIRTSTISAYKAWSAGAGSKSTNNRWDLQSLVTGKDGAPERYVYELHSETIDANGNWCGEELEDVIRNEERELILSEPRVLVNMSVSYYEPSYDSSMSGRNKGIIVYFMDNLSRTLAQATDGHMMINKVLYGKTDERTDMYVQVKEDGTIDFSRTALASMADIQIRSYFDEFRDSKVMVHSNAYVDGYLDRIGLLATGGGDILGRFKGLTPEERDSIKSKNFEFQRIEQGWVDSSAYFDKTGQLHQKLYITSTHEAGHYLLSFYDEYLNGEGNPWTNDTFGDNNRPAGAPSNFGLMDDQRAEIEMSRAYDYRYLTGGDPAKKQTAQYSRNNKSCEDHLADNVFAQDYNISGYKANYTKISAAGISPSEPEATGRRRANYSYAAVPASRFIEFDGKKKESGSASPSLSPDSITESDIYASAKPTSEPLADVALDSAGKVKITPYSDGEYKLYCKDSLSGTIREIALEKHSGASADGEESIAEPIPAAPVSGSDSEDEDDGDKASDTSEEETSGEDSRDSSESISNDSEGITYAVNVRSLNAVSNDNSITEADIVNDDDASGDDKDGGDADTDSKEPDSEDAPDSDEENGGNAGTDGTDSEVLAAPKDYYYTGRTGIAQDGSYTLYLVNKSDEKSLINEFDTETAVSGGYYYKSLNNTVHAYFIPSSECGFTITASSTEAENGEYRSVNDVTDILTSGSASVRGELYSVANINEDIDYTSVSWFRYADGKWTKLSTDISYEENMNIGARCDYAGAGRYVLMAKPASKARLMPVTGLKYSNQPDRDDIVILKFDDSNTESVYYNIYYSDSPFSDENGKSVYMEKYRAGDDSYALYLKERNKTAYVAVKAIAKDGASSALSQLIEVNTGEADRDRDGIPDWYCDKYYLWPEGGAEKDIANSDDDKDGLTNLEEYSGDTDPRDPFDPVTSISVQSVSLNTGSVTTHVNGTATITASVNPSNATDTGVEWYIDDDSIASASGSGLKCTVRGKKVGRTRVTVVTKDGGYTASASVNITSTDIRDHKVDTSRWVYDEYTHWHICADCSEKHDEAPHTADGGTYDAAAGTYVYRCSVCGCSMNSGYSPAPGSDPGQGPGTPASSAGSPSSGSGASNNNYSTADKKLPYIQGTSKSGWEVITKELTFTPNGKTVTVNMNGTTELPESAVRVIMNRDINLVLLMNNSFRWTVNGMTVTNPKTVDMGVAKRKNARIPSGLLEKISKGNESFQLVLNNKGDFGFTAELKTTLGKKYEGLCSNLFCYDSREKALYFNGSKTIKDGVSKHKFTRSADCVIVISKEALGTLEDVASCAGTAANAVPIDFAMPVTNGVNIPAIKIPDFPEYSTKKRRYRILRKRRLDDMVFVY